MDLRQIRIAIFSSVAALSLILFFVAFNQGISPSDVADFAKSHLGSAPQVNPDGLAYMTFLTETTADLNDVDPEHDRYFVATRILAYTILHQPSTKTQRNIPFVVLVTKEVSQNKRDILAKDGATIIEVEHLRPKNDWATERFGNPRWADVYTKFRAWELTQYSRIVFLDGDTFLFGCMDGLFDDPGTQPISPLDHNVKADEAPLTGPYVFGSVGETAPHHKIPPKDKEDFQNHNSYENYINAGYFVFGPSRMMFDYYMSIMEIPDRFDPIYPEQNLLNYAHRQDGPAPMQHTGLLWNVRHPSMTDVESGVKSLHDKWWAPIVDPKLRAVYARLRGKMESYYEARELAINGTLMT